MSIDWNRELVDQIDWHWQNHFRPALDELTDAEYLWEPVPGCWSIRPRAEATSRQAAGSGDVVIDFEDPGPSPAPITTIAWRLGHIAVDIFGERASNQFGDGSVRIDTTDWSLTAKGGLEVLDTCYDAWVSGVRAVGEAGLARPCGPSEGPFSEAPLAALVLHLNREALHHGGEVMLLRDLYAAKFS